MTGGLVALSVDNVLEILLNTWFSLILADFSSDVVQIIYIFFLKYQVSHSLSHALPGFSQGSDITVAFHNFST